MTGIIYKATNLYNGLSYIGQTRVSLEKRMKQHLKDAVADTLNHFHIALMQYGKEGFQWDILDEFVGTKEEVIHALNVAEEYHILKHKTRLSECGYNATQGGYSSDKFDDAIRKRALANYGGRAILQYDLGGNFLKEYESIAEVCRCMGVKSKNKGKYFLGRAWRGYQWREKKNEYYPRNIEPYLSKESRKAVVVYGSDGMFYAEFESIKKCRDVLGVACKVRSRIEDLEFYASSVPSYFVFAKPSLGYPDSIKINKVKPRGKIKENRESDYLRTSILQYSPKGEFIGEYESVASASRTTGIAETTIRKYLKRNSPFRVDYSTKFIWQKKNGEIPMRVNIYEGRQLTSHRKEGMEHRVIQYDKNGNLVKIWKNMLQASIQMDESLGLIRKQCMGIKTKKKTVSLWRYYTPDYPQTISVA